MTMTAERPTPARVPRTGLLVALLVGSAVALGLGVYGNVHDPTGRSLVTLFFTATINAKVWLATGAVTLALFQLWSAFRIYGKLGSKPAAKWLGSAHRISGTTAFLLTLPVSYHCLWALGFTTEAGNRILIHSLLGCFFYGAFAAKMLILRNKNVPNWALPWAGGLVFTALVFLWFTSSFWFFTNVEFPGF